MNRFLSKGVIGIIIGVIALSPIAFSVQGIGINKASAVLDFKLDITASGTTDTKTTITWGIEATDKNVKTLDFLIQKGDYVGANNPFDANKNIISSKVQEIGVPAFFDGPNDVQIGYSSKKTLDWQKKFTAIYYENSKNIVIDNAGFVLLFPKDGHNYAKETDGYGKYPPKFAPYVIKFDTTKTAHNGSFIINNLASGTDYTAVLLLVNKDAGDDSVKTVDFKTTGASSGTAGYTAEGSIGIDTNSVAQTDEKGQINPDESMPNCFSWGDGLSVSGCFAQLLYYVLYVPTSWMFMLAGMFFDYTFDYSIQSSSYDNSSQFVQKAWSLVRDLCNILFIVIMIYVAIGTLLGIAGVNWKSMILQLIITAVMINFSLFVTQIIIDAGNVTARLFYNSDTISITKTVDGKKVQASGMSEVIVSGFDPQKIVLEGKEKLYDDVNSRGGGRDSRSKNGAAATGDLDNTTFILITLCSIVLNVVGAGVFFKIALLFVGRVIGLWFQAIKSPIAFMSQALPKKWNIGKISFNGWLSETFQMSFMAPIFMALMYMILLFVQIGIPIMKTGTETHTAWVLGIIVPFIFIITMMKMAQTMATKWAGEVAKDLSGALSKGLGIAGGLAVGAATGGVALAGRATIGAAANSAGGAKLAERLAAAEAKGGIRGKLAGFGLKSFDKAKDGSFDARNTKAFGSATGALSKGAGVDLSGKATNAFMGNAGLSMKSFGMDAKQHGISTMIKEKQEKTKKEIKRQSKISHVTDNEFKEYHNKKVDRYENNYAEFLKKKGVDNYKGRGEDDKKEIDKQYLAEYEKKKGERITKIPDDAKEEDIKAVRQNVEDKRRDALNERMSKRFDDYTVSGSVMNWATSRIKNDNIGKGAVVAGGVGAGVRAGVMAGGLAGGALGGVFAGASIAESAVVTNKAYSQLQKEMNKEKEKQNKEKEKLSNENEDLERKNKELDRRIKMSDGALIRNDTTINNQLPDLKAKIDTEKNSEEYKKIEEERKALEKERDRLDSGKKEDGTDMTEEEKKKAKKIAEDVAKNVLRKEHQLQEIITTTVADYAFEETEKYKNQMFKMDQDGASKDEIDKVRRRMSFVASVASDRTNLTRSRNSMNSDIAYNKEKIKTNKSKIGGEKPKEETK